MSNILLLSQFSYILFILIISKILLIIAYWENHTKSEHYPLMTPTTEHEAIYFSTIKGTDKVKKSSYGALPP